MEKISRINHPEKYNSHLTNDFRTLAAEKLGELDTATSFMYLFRRFKTPTYDNSDEYKILYQYNFKFKDIIVSIHASYHQFVTFNLWIPKKSLTPFYKENRKYHKQQLRKSLQRNIAYMPYSVFFYQIKESDLFTPKQSEKQWYHIDREAKEILTSEEYNFLDTTMPKNDVTPGESQRIIELCDKLSDHLTKKFRSSISASDRKRLYHWMPTLNDVPEIRKQCLQFIQELKRGCYVRDEIINIKGYISENNPIHRFE
ncbi:hypothetical protein [Draconibacterium mangrovi]|uniref:hypothetical protein n=1 Tax=Draconibacterium mangrovi TaxID=2697469 RepID=UPI0013D38E53|nr:hypothetical protein [Draconibacterium mangrovi]